MYTEYLKQLGLDDKEIAVFLAVLERGKVLPATVAIITNINRSTVYSVAKELARKGLLQIDVTSEPSYLVIESESVLENLYKQDMRTIEERKQVVASAMDALSSIPKSKHYSVPKVKFYNEHELKSALYDRLPIWAENAIQINEPSWWGFQDVSLVDRFPEWIVDHYDIIPKTVATHMFTNARLAEKDIHEKVADDRRVVKYLNDEKHEFTATQAVLGDYIVYVMTNEKPYYMIEIHDRVMAHNLREVFKMLWEKV